MLTDSLLEAALHKIPKARITVFGDFCLDVYWLLDMDEVELSVETGLPVRRVREQHYSLGGAGNAVANLVDLGVGEVRAVGVVGKDLFGVALLDLLRGRGVNLDGFEVADDCAGLGESRVAGLLRFRHREHVGGFRNAERPALASRVARLARVRIHGARMEHQIASSPHRDFSDLSAVLESVAGII